MTVQQSTSPYIHHSLTATSNPELEIARDNGKAVRYPQIRRSLLTEYSTNDETNEVIDLIGLLNLENAAELAALVDQSPERAY